MGKRYRKRYRKRIMAGLLCLALLGLTACGSIAGNAGDPESYEREPRRERIETGNSSENVRATELSGKVTANRVTARSENPSATVNATDFGLRLFREEIKAGENTLVSPASVLFALGMTANGAKGNTLAEFEKVFGMSAEEMNLYLYAYRKGLPNEKNCKVRTANSIWFIDDPRLTVNEDFLQRNADYYAAGIYEAPFDETTREDINNWVKENTDGMIPEIVDEIPADAVMYLVNAMAFDAKWEKPYEEKSVQEWSFTCEDGTVQKADFMFSEEGCLLKDENAIGVLKYYKGKKYAFAALMPEEGLTLEQYAATLTGERLNRILQDPEHTEVDTAIPKFEAEYSTELSNALTDMGLADAFSMDDADFTGLGESTNGNIYIKRVLHKTYISVDEKGTKASAATAVEMVDKAAVMIDERVYLDRPFVYFLIDCEEGLPIFMGTVYTLE